MKYIITCDKCGQVSELERKPAVMVDIKAQEYNRLHKKQFRAAKESFLGTRDIYEQRIHSIKGYLLNTFSKNELRRTELVKEKMDETYRQMKANEHRRKERYMRCPLCEQKLYLY